MSELDTDKLRELAGKALVHHSRFGQFTAHDLARGLLSVLNALEAVREERDEAGIARDAFVVELAAAEAALEAANARIGIELDVANQEHDRAEAALEAANRALEWYAENCDEPLPAALAGVLRELAEECLECDGILGPHFHTGDRAMSDEQTFRDFVEWTANLTDWELKGYDWFAHRANARNLLAVAEGGRLDAGKTGAEQLAALLWAVDPTVLKDGEGKDE
jgi:hypothetical protein